MDAIAKRYGVRPSEIANGTIEDFMLDVLVATKGVEHERKIAEKQARRSRTRR